MSFRSQCHGDRRVLLRTRLRGPGRARWKPRVEPLEGRALLTTFFVAISGADDPAGGGTAAPFRSIQFAVNRAVSGDVIKVASGSYGYNPAGDVTSRDFGTTAVVAMFNKQLTIQGGFTTADWNTYDPAANSTVIDGEDRVRGVLVVGLSGPTALTLQGVTVTRGIARGIPARGGDEAINAFGGGMFVDVAVANLRDVAFVSNRAIGEETGQGAGGSGAGGGLAMRSTSNATVGTLQDVTFAGNFAQGGRGPERGGLGQGGGLFTFQYTVNGANLAFSDNRAVGGGTGGGGAFAGDLGDGQGGGVAIHIDSVGNLSGVHARGNAAVGGSAPNGDAGGAYGGGVYAERARLTLADSDVRGNTAQGGDGNNSGTPTRGAGFANGGGLMTINTPTAIERSFFLANIARGGIGAVFKGSSGGGGIALVRQAGSAAAASIVNSVIADNLAALGGGTDDRTGGGGGGIWLDGPATTITHSTIARNGLLGGNPSRPTQQGQGILVLGIGTSTTASFAFNVIADHVNNLSAGSGFAAALSVSVGSTANLDRNLFAGNSKDTNADGRPSPAGTFNLFGPSITAATAGFLSPGPANFDYRLTAGSAAVDAAIGSGLAVDLTSGARQGTPDIGAYELGAATPSPRVSNPPPIGGGAGGGGGGSGGSGGGGVPISDTTPPRLVSVTAVRTGRPRNRRITRFDLLFSEALEASRAQDLDNYTLAELRRGRGRRGLPRRLALVAARYDPTTNVVTLVVAGRPRFPRGAQITVSAAVTDVAGNPLDGDADGISGPSAVVRV